MKLVFLCKTTIMATKHIGFKAAAKKVMKEGYSKKVAGAVIASAARKASSKAKAANPRLNRVKG